MTAYFIGAISLIVLTFAVMVIHIGVLFTVGILAVIVAAILSGVACLITAGRGLFHQPRQYGEHF